MPDFCRAGHVDNDVYHAIVTGLGAEGKTDVDFLSFMAYSKTHLIYNAAMYATAPLCQNGT